MNYYTIIPLAAFTVNLITFTYILALKSKSPVNWAYLAVAANFALWSLTSFIFWPLPAGPWLLSNTVRQDVSCYREEQRGR